MTISPDWYENIVKRRVCVDCIGEAYLAQLADKEGTERKCHYCRKKQQCVTLEWFANHVETAFETHYERTADEPNSLEYAIIKDKESDYDRYREGDTTTDAIVGAALIDDIIANDIQSVLEFRHEDFDCAAAGIECEFSSDAYYEVMIPESHEWDEQWDNFEQDIKTKSRFFSQNGANTLGKIFDQIDQMRTRAGKSLVACAGPGEEVSHLYRARVFQSEKPLLEAMKRPDLELSAPPSWAAAAGRMNARGISAFYGATAEETAIAEVRPPVGSRVALAKFDIIRPLRLLDLAALGEVTEHGSIFDPDYVYRLRRMMFLRTLNNRISKPVMPDDQDLEYLPTQAIADYLATEGQASLDGIMFPSVQTGITGSNVVLFHKASRSRILEIPKATNIDARTCLFGPEGMEPDYYVIEETPRGQEECGTNKNDPLEFPETFGDWEHDLDHDQREETLEIDLESVCVHEVNAVEVRTSKHVVSRHRCKKNDSNF